MLLSANHSCPRPHGNSGYKKKKKLIALAEYFRDIHHEILNFINFRDKLAFCLVIYSALVSTYYFTYNNELIIEY